MNTFRTRITRLAVASALAVTLGGIGAGQALAAGGTTLTAPVRTEAVEDGGAIQGAPCVPFNKCLMD